MVYILIGICLIVTVLFIVFSKKNTAQKEQTSIKESTINSSEVAITNSEHLNELIIQTEMLPTEYELDENKLVEVKDRKVLAHVNNLIPGLIQIGNAANNAIQAAQANNEVVYRAILPAGAKLVNSKDMGNAFRGFFRGADGIRGHANFMAVEAQKGTEIVANTASAAMGVAAMVVGQYYMEQINNQLGEINDGISKISDFQDNEYRSRVFSLITHVKEIAKFQVEILENNDLIYGKITQLDRLEEECTKLLGQANLTLADYTKKNMNDFKVYEGDVQDIHKWFSYQKTLLDILYKISDLRYTLQLGSVSREQCGAILQVYSQQVVDTQSRLTTWHQDIWKILNIELEESRRKRRGFDGAIHYVPGLINKKLNFREIDQDTVAMIGLQVSGTNDFQVPKQTQTELYQEDVQLISKNGKVYYLPEASVS